jgi:hypothetical protein
MMNRNKLTVAVGIAVGATAGVLSTAQAGQLFFPQAVVGTTVTTIFSVINTEGNTPGEGTDRLHYRYYYKDPTMLPPLTGDPETDEDAANALHCSETNKFLPTSKYDIQTIDIGGDLPGSVDGVMFNDPSVNNNWLGHGNFAMAGSVPKPHRGYLYVSHGPTMGQTVAGGAGLYGEAMIFEFDSGGAWGYQGFWKAGGDCDFRNAASNSPSHVAIFPLEGSAFTTKFMVTPLWDVMSRPNLPSASVCPDDHNWNTAWIELEAAPEYGSNIVMFDRDENPISGATPKEVACVGAVTSEYLVNVGSRDDLADGGWTGVLNYTRWRDNTNTVQEIEPSAVVYKLEYGNVSSIDPGKDGIFNNAIYLLPETQWGVPEDVNN